MVRPKLKTENVASERGNRFIQVLEIAARAKRVSHELTRASLAEEFFRENFEVHSFNLPFYSEELSAMKEEYVRRAVGRLPRDRAGRLRR